MQHRCNNSIKEQLKTDLTEQPAWSLVDRARGRPAKQKNTIQVNGRAANIEANNTREANAQPSAQHKQGVRSELQVDDFVGHVGLSPHQACATAMSNERKKQNAQRETTNESENEQTAQTQAQRITPQQTNNEQSRHTAIILRASEVDDCGEAVVACGA